MADSDLPVTFGCDCANLRARLADVETEHARCETVIRTMNQNHNRMTARLAEAEAERDKFREHSVELNSVGWRLAEAVGDVGPGDTQIESSAEERSGRVDRLRARLAAVEALLGHGYCCSECEWWEQNVRAAARGEGDR